MKVNEYHSTVDQVRKAYQSEGTKRLEEEGNKNRTHAKQGKMVTTKEKRQIPEKEKTIGAKYSPSEVLAADSDPVVIARESNLKVCNKKADGGERTKKLTKHMLMIYMKRMTSSWTVILKMATQTKFCII